jgi:hypothetical protein
VRKLRASFRARHRSRGFRCVEANASNRLK